MEKITLEEDYLNKLVEDANKEITIAKKIAEEVAIEFSKWQQEGMYSDMQEYAEFCIECDRANLKPITAKDWFEQFKKKTL